jgi:hypothetical protein
MSRKRSGLEQDEIVNGRDLKMAVLTISILSVQRRTAHGNREGSRFSALSGLRTTSGARQTETRPVPLPQHYSLTQYDRGLLPSGCAP